MQFGTLHIFLKRVLVAAVVLFALPLNVGDVVAAEHEDILEKRKALIDIAKKSLEMLPDSIRTSLATHAVDEILNYSIRVNDTLPTVGVATVVQYVKRESDTLGVAVDVIVLATSSSSHSPVHVAVVSKDSSGYRVLLDSCLEQIQGRPWIRRELIGIEPIGFCTPVVGGHCGMTAACFWFLSVDATSAKISGAFGCDGFELIDLDQDGIREITVHSGTQRRQFKYDASIREWTSILGSELPK